MIPKEQAQSLRRQAPRLRTSVQGPEGPGTDACRQYSESRLGFLDLFVREPERTQGTRSQSRKQRVTPELPCDVSPGCASFPFALGEKRKSVTRNHS